jgi:predicted RNase H-like nuclease (RuvC/YqgF family)
VGKFIPVEPEKWAEMVKAQAENARLKAEVERLNNESDILQKCCEHQKNRIERLKAEVERLTKAGDEMEKVIWLAECIAGVEHTEKSSQAWNAAKKGGQP